MLTLLIASAIVQSVRLFDFGRIDAQIQAAKGRDAELLAVYRLAVLRATEDVENALTAQLRREEQAALLVSGEASLAQARQASSLAYQKGVVPLIEVLQADERLLRTADARAQAQTSAAHATVATFKALGGGWRSNGTTQLVTKERRGCSTQAKTFVSSTSAHEIGRDLGVSRALDSSPTFPLPFC